MADRIRIIRNDGDVTVKDYAFSQVCEMFQGNSREEIKQFDRGIGIVIAKDSIFASAGEKAKLVRI
jgi:hypothetical protein